MKNRRPILTLILIMATIVVMVEGLSLYLLYQEEFSERTAQLVEMAESQARLMEAIARFDFLHSENDEIVGGAEEATLSKLRDARKYDKGFGKTGEVTLGKLTEDNQIEFLLSHRHGILENRNQVPFDSDLAEPMQRALTSKSGGTMIGLDYRGKMVVAAYEPVAVLNYGLVAKIDMAEIKKPFINAIFVSLLLMVFLILCGTWLFIQIGNPLIDRLEESENKYQTLFDNSSDGVYLYADRYVDCNKEACHQMACKRSDIIGKIPNDFAPTYQPDGKKSEEAVKIYAEAAMAGSPQRFYWQRKRPNGTLFDTIISLKAIYLNGKKMLLVIVRDVTNERKQETALRQHQKMESIGTLASGVAHEINNPINGIMNYAQLIGERLDKESPLREYTEEIIHESERVSTIVRNLLTFSRDEKESHSPANIADIVDASISLLNTILRRDQITLEVDVADDLPKIKCRSQQIQQVLMNLVTNARDALNDRYREYDENKIMKVTVRSFEKENQKWIRTTVEDHGAGIPENIRNRIFDPFFTTKDRSKGTGLGLSISYGIVQDHQGELHIESEQGQFSRCHIDLPVNNGWS